MYAPEEWPSHVARRGQNPAYRPSGMSCHTERDDRPVGRLSRFLCLGGVFGGPGCGHGGQAQGAGTGGGCAPGCDLWITSGCCV